MSGIDVSSLAPLTRGFFQRPTAAVARDLLAHLLVRDTPAGRVVVRLTEVEAYLGVTDPAAHTFAGRRTARVAAMWGEPGHAYVYLVYGLHHCLNVVTCAPGVPEAVLVRGAVAVEGTAIVRRRRGGGVPPARLLDGPGKLCQGLGISRTEDGADLTNPASGLWLASDGTAAPGADIVQTPRIGVDYAGEAATWPLRFVWRPSPPPEIG